LQTEGASARLAEVHQEIGKQSKPQVGAAFAAEVAAPAEISDLYRDMWTRWNSLTRSALT
jgi:hypothetical protein